MFIFYNCSKDGDIFMIKRSSTSLVWRCKGSGKYRFIFYNCSKDANIFMIKPWSTSPIPRGTEILLLCILLVGPTMSIIDEGKRYCYCVYSFLLCLLLMRERDIATVSIATMPIIGWFYYFYYWWVCTMPIIGWSYYVYCYYAYYWLLLLCLLLVGLTMSIIVGMYHN